MFGIGWSEFVLIALVLLIFVGPRHLPAVLKKAGMVIGELKRASRELQHQVSEEVRDIERTMGDIKSPDALLRDLSDDIKDGFKEGFKDPYDEIRQSDAAFQAELRNIQTEIKSAGQSADTTLKSEDADPGSGAPLDSKFVPEKPKEGERE